MPRYEITAEFRSGTITMTITASDPDDACYQIFRKYSPEKQQELKVKHCSRVSEIHLYKPDEDCEGAD